MHLAATLPLLLAALSTAKNCTTIANRYGNGKTVPSSVTCYATGQLEKPAVIKSFGHESSKYGVPCIEACYADSSCKSISVASTDSGVTGCTLYSEVVADMALNSSATDPGDRDFDDLECFKCIVCDPETQAPKITDGTFDNSATSISPWRYVRGSSGAKYALVPGQPGDGNAFSVNITSTSGIRTAILRQTVPICAPAASNYTFSFDYAFGTDNQDSSFSASFIDESTPSIDPVDTAWHTYTDNVFWNAISSQVAFTFLVGSGEQTFYLDNVVLAPTKK